MGIFNPEKEYLFQQAYKKMATKLGLSLNPDDPKHFYDWRALYDEDPTLTPDAENHFPSKHKKPGHEREFIDGVSTITGKKTGVFDFALVEKEKEKKVIPGWARRMRGIGKTEEPTGTGTLEAEGDTGAKAIGKFDFALKPVLLPTIEQEEKELKDFEDTYEALNESITTDYNQYVDLQKELEELGLSLQEVPEDLVWYLQKKFEEVKETHNSLVDKLQADTAEQKSIYESYTVARKKYEEDVDIYNRFANATKKTSEATIPPDYSPDEIARQLKEGTFVTGKKPSKLSTALGAYGTLGKALSLLPKSAKITFLQAAGGKDAAGINDTEEIDTLLKEMKDIDEFIKEAYLRYGNEGIFGIKVTDLAELAQNLGFSVSSMSAFAAAAIPIGLIPFPGSRIAAWAAGTAASGAVAYRATEFQIMQSYLEFKNEESIRETGKPINVEEEKLLKEMFDADAVSYALWEAIPEAISNLNFGLVLTKPLSKVAGKKAASFIIDKLGRVYLGEFSTEMITQMGQSGIEVGVGMRPGPAPSWTNPRDYIEALKEIAPQTFLLTTVMGAGGAGVVGIAKGFKKITKSLKAEVGENHPLYKVMEAKLIAKLVEQRGSFSWKDLTEKEVNLLAEEAKKYKSAEEFVKAQFKAEVFYIRRGGDSVEIIKNPSETDRRGMQKDLREKYQGMPVEDLTEELEVRELIDDRGNVYIFPGDALTHEDVELWLEDRGIYTGEGQLEGVKEKEIERLIALYDKVAVTPTNIEKAKEKLIKRGVREEFLTPEFMKEYMKHPEIQELERGEEAKVPVEEEETLEDLAGLEEIESSAEELIAAAKEVEPTADELDKVEKVNAAKKKFMDAMEIATEKKRVAAEDRKRQLVREEEEEDRKRREEYELSAEDKAAAAKERKAVKERIAKIEKELEEGFKVEPKELGEKFTGKAFRAETKLPEHGAEMIAKMKTAQEKLDYDYGTTGNEIFKNAKKIAEDLGIDVSKVPIKELVWVAPDLKTAEKYGEAKEVKLSEDTIVLAKDEEGGSLVLQNAEKYKVAPKMPVEIPQTITKLDEVIKKKMSIEEVNAAVIGLVNATEGKTLTKEQDQLIEDKLDEAHTIQRKMIGGVVTLGQEFFRQKEAPRIGPAPEKGIVYRTEKTAKIYKGKRIWGQGLYFGMTRRDVEYLMEEEEEGAEIPDYTLVKRYVLPDDIKLKTIDITGQKEKKRIGRGFKEKILAEGYDGIEVLTGDDMILGGDQIVIYNPEAIRKIKLQAEPKASMKKAGFKEPISLKTQVKNDKRIVKRLRESIKKAKETKEDVKTIKQAVHDYAKDMPLAIRGKVLTALKTAVKLVDLNEAMTKMDEYVETYYRRQYVKAIEKELTAKKIAPKKAISGILKGKFTAEVQRALNVIKGGIHKSRVEALEQIDKNIKAFEAGETTDVAGVNELLNMQGIKEMTLKDLESTLDNIKTLKKVGKTLKAEKETARKEALQGKVIKTIETITGEKLEIDKETGKPKLDTAYKTMSKAKWSEKGLLNRAKKAIDSFMNWQFAWDNLLDKLSALDKTSKPYESELSKIGFAIQYARINQIQGVEEIITKLQDVFSKAYKIEGKKNVLDKVGEHKRDVNLGTFKNAEGHTVELVLNKEQIMKKYMQLEDPTLDKTFTKGMLYTDEIKDAIRGAITEQDKAYIDGLRGIYDTIYEKVNPIYMDLYGVDLPRNPHYSGRIIREGKDNQNIPENLLQVENAIHYASVLNPSLKERSRTLSSLKYNEATPDILRYTLQMEHFVAFAKPLQELRGIFGNSAVKAIIKQGYGDQIYRKITDQLQDITRDAVDRANTIARVDKIRGNLTRSILAKPIIGIKQVPSILAYMTEMPTADFFKGIANFWKNPITNYRLLMELSPYAKERFGKGFERDIHFAMRQGWGNILAGAHKFSDIFFTHIRMGDKLAVVQGMWAKMYSETGGQVLKAGKDKVIEGFRSAERSTERTQPTYTIESLAAGQRGGSFLKLLTMFQVQINKYYRIIADNARNFRYGRGSRIKAASNIVLAWVVLPLLFQLIGSAGKIKDKDLYRILLIGPLNDILVFGQMARSIYGWLAGDTYDYQVSPVVSTMKELQKALQKVVKWTDPTKEMTTDDFIKMVEYAAKAIGQTTGMPTPYGVQLTEAARAGDWRQVLYSPYALDEEERKVTGPVDMSKIYEAMGIKKGKGIKGKIPTTAIDMSEIYESMGLKK